MLKFINPSTKSNFSEIATISTNSKLLSETSTKHIIFIEELKTVLINEKIIDKSNSLFKGLLSEQQKYNKVFYSLKPYKIICFIKCDYYLYDKNTPRVFHKDNKIPYNGDYKFVELLQKNNMNMRWWGENILYIYKNK